MSDTAENLRAFLTDVTAIATVAGERIHQDHVPQKKDRPYVWFRQAGIEDDPCLDDAVGANPFKILFDLECCATSSGVAKNLAKLVRDNVHNYSGPFGEGKVKAVFVNEHDDDYVPRNGNGDAGLFVATFSLEVIPRW